MLLKYPLMKSRRVAPLIGMAFPPPLRVSFGAINNTMSGRREESVEEHT
jgi:hypothetical protein